MKELLIGATLMANILILSLSTYYFGNDPLLAGACIFGSICLIVKIITYMVREYKKIADLSGNENHGTYRKRRFTMLELMTVIAIVSILLGITMTIARPDKAANDITNIRSVIELHQAKAYAEINGNDYFEVMLRANDLTVDKIEAGNRTRVHYNTITTGVTFEDGSTSKSFKIKPEGSVYDITGNAAMQFIFTVGDRKGKMNIFTGHISLGQELL